MNSDQSINLGKKIKNEDLGGENEEGERKTMENCIKNGGKGLQSGL